MATSTQVVPAVGTSGVLALWHLLSLDAPTVAVIWTWFVARAEHVRLPWATPAAMGIAVWMLYAGDRLLDARVLDGVRTAWTGERLEARHLFHYRHRRGFLVDEIFSGTNSEDRRTAAGAVLERLLANGAIGALSTHDLALTELATAANAGVNVHMASPDADDPLAFDYLLKPGVNTASSALAILRLIGIGQL